METEQTTHAARRQVVLDAHSDVLSELDLPAESAAAAESAMAVARIVRGLDAAEDLVIAALLQPLIEGKFLVPAVAEQRFGAAPLKLVRSLGELGGFGLPPDWNPERGLEPGQAEALRKMLLAVIGDARLVVVKLAQQLQQLRAAKLLDPTVQRRFAVETREVYAPLANRLGIWQLKWELEDLAFRFLEPAQYKLIASALKARRSEREHYIEDLKRRLERTLVAAGIDARVEGRPKHIYSIWRKMQTKRLAFDQLMDIAAARILVSDVAACYAALGAVHSLWPFIRGEFDDYIATPKPNQYRSIHTAILGPGGQAVEIQIRTHEMHAFCELGVASHWRYKEGGPGDDAYERKIAKLRSLLAPDKLEDTGDFIDRIRNDLFRDRIYAMSPRGEIVDVPIGGTPLDFAYQIHSGLGHRTRGAKVNGKMAALNHPLKNSDTVEILTARSPQPSRDWLSARTGFLASARHRAKVRAFFRKQDAAALKPERDDGPVPQPILQRTVEVVRPTAVREPESEVQGVGDLLSTYARCCRPVPPQPIAGYITVGRGVSIHAKSCANLARLCGKAPLRVLAVSWGSVAGAEFPVDIEVQAFDRRGLVRDVSAALADAGISIQSLRTSMDRRDHIAQLRIQLSITDLAQLTKVLARIAKLPSIISARRKS